MDDRKESENFFHSLPFEVVGIKKAICIFNTKFAI
jgi:hypothetical protein